MTDKPSDIQRGKPERVPINGRRDILSVKGIPENLHACWVADYPENPGENLQRYLEAGYDFWTKDDVKVGDRHVNRGSQIGAKISRPGGNGVTLYLMVCPMDVYQDECRRISVEVDAKEATMYRDAKSAEARYGKLTIEHTSKKA